MGRKLKNTNGNDFIANTTEVASLFYDIAPSVRHGKLAIPNQFNWVYNNLRNYGNVFVSTQIYEKLDKHKLGKHKLEPVKRVHPEGNDGYIIWKK